MHIRVGKKAELGVASPLSHCVTAGVIALHCREAVDSPSFLPEPGGVL